MYKSSKLSALVVVIWANHLIGCLCRFIISSSPWNFITIAHFFLVGNQLLISFSPLLIFVKIICVQTILVGVSFIVKCIHGLFLIETLTKCICLISLLKLLMLLLHLLVSTLLSLTEGSISKSCALWTTIHCVDIWCCGRSLFFHCVTIKLFLLELNSF